MIQKYINYLAELISNKDFIHLWINIVVVIFIIGVIISLFRIVINVSLPSPDEKGKIYENKVASRLLSMIKDSNVIQNVYLDNGKIKDDGTPGETEADIILINKKGVFVVECKYHESRLGMIYGAPTGEWYFKNGSVRENPVEQNAKHVKAAIRGASNVVDNAKDAVFNVVITNSRVEYTYWGIKSMDYSQDYSKGDHPVILIGNDAIYGLREIIDKKPDILDDIEVKLLSDYFTSRQDIVSAEEHIAYVNEQKSKYHPTRY